MNYGRARLVMGGDDDPERYLVEVIVYMPITQHVACAVSAFMLCLSRLFRVEYDGWGSVGQREPEAR